ncbi:recombinase family protein [Streptomyces sp. G1]|uniref:recombinase family protein n=1 Tax=Streptomyces sp. G1 TaxID=361572 RepID=UPI00202F3F34|nr:recombinase family protein [Streptomyces sp. G1]MCM1977199.1 recombinase family protein [Streptomyces sp. G1]
MAYSLAGLVGREYLRVSAKGDRSIPEQHEDNARSAEREGVILAAPYKDQGSASRYAQRARDDFDRLVDDLKNGQFGADLLWLWESSRGSRRVGEWVTLIELCEEQGVRVFVTTHSRVYDPADPRDRRSLLEDAVDSEYESAKISKRTLRGLEANAAEGKPHGICPFGFDREYEIRRGKRVPIRQFPHAVEAPLVVELFERVRARVPFTVIEEDWARRGVLGRRGKPMSAQTLRDLVTHVCYIGLRSVKGRLVKASWPRLVSDELFYDVQQLISDPSRIKGNPGTARYALTGAVPCGGCSGPITVRNRPKETTYECKRGCWRVSKAEVDQILVGDAERPGLILKYLSREENYRALDAEDASEEVAEIRDALAKARADLRETEEAEAETLEEERRFARRAERLRTRIADLEEQRKKFVRPSKLRELFPSGPNVAARWHATPVPAQRAVVELLLTPAVLGEVQIMPSSSTARSVAERIVIRRARHR